MMEYLAGTWYPIETAPKGTPGSYSRGPDILGVCVGSWGATMNIVAWQYYKDAKKGAWKGPLGVWEPDFWSPLPKPPLTDPTS